MHIFGVFFGLEIAYLRKWWKILWQKSTILNLKNFPSMRQRIERLIMSIRAAKPLTCIERVTKKYETIINKPSLALKLSLFILKTICTWKSADWSSRCRGERCLSTRHSCGDWKTINFEIPPHGTWGKIYVKYTVVTKIFACGA